MSITKQEEFLWIVQTAILADSIRVTSRREIKDNSLQSGVGAKNFMGDAVRFAGRIPSNLAATEAADDFWEWIVKGVEKDKEAVAGETLPLWLLDNT
jgi:hypothetical protein